MKAVYMIGSFSTKFGKRVEETHKAITRETYLGVLQDAGIEAMTLKPYGFPIADGV